ncbi:hypothetical protein [Streptomyces olivaceus]|uniref:hypothetical protein n=1 Tax=Streptomyces olivaceus TaxID=47716 RepID=UPI0022EE9224|nr:hypothetical protein [Streptomyces olivaceus]GHI91301.1 hypothetical protein TPA0905_07720 [Streptomyces olivaceus]
MTLALAVLLALAVGWCWGHRTARVRIIPVGALATEDEAALLAADRARFEEIAAQLRTDTQRDPSAGSSCGAPHHLYPETLCTEPAGHYVRDRHPHGGPLIISGRECGGAAWDEPQDAA